MGSKKKLLADHKQIGKKFFPPAARFGWTEIHYTDEILPEIVWIAYFPKCFGTAIGIKLVGRFIEVCYSLKDWSKKPEFSLLSAYRILSTQDWLIFRSQLKAIGILQECQKAISPFVGCYSLENPLSNLFESDEERRCTKARIELSREVVSELFDRRSKEASLVQSTIMWMDIKVGKYHVPAEYPFKDFISIFGDCVAPQDGTLTAHARMHVNSTHQFYRSEIGDSWARYFWNQGRSLVPLLTDNAGPILEDNKRRHPIVAFGLEYERHMWLIVDAIWSKLPVDIYQSEVFEVIGALLARQCNLAAKLAQNTDLWDYHAGPLFLRPMTDCYITMAWILKDQQSRAQKFILYGLGQEKLEIERLKSVLGEQDEENRARLQQRIDVQEAWLNAQHYSFLQHVDIGSWSGITTRQMAEEADCLNLYNFAYVGWSHAAHGTWNHIGRFDACPTLEPLHKHIWQPANMKHDYQIDIVEKATKYFDEMCVLLVDKFALEMEIANPNAWLAGRLPKLFTDLELYSNSKSKN